MIVHKPDMNAIRDEAAKIEKEQESRGNRGNIKRYVWKVGNNNLRLLPCWAAHGRLFQKESTHWELMPGKKQHYCLIETWPSKTDHCAICDAIDKILAMFPQLELRRQMPASKYAANVIDRDDEDSGVQIVRFTPAVYNWLLLEMANPKIGDVTDLETGVDLKVVLKEVKRKDGSTGKEYTPNWIPRPSMLNEDDTIVAQWLDSLFDLEKLRPYPSDEKIGEITSQASSMVAYYVKKYKQDSDRGKEAGEAAATQSAEVVPSPDKKKPAPKKREAPQERAASLEDSTPKGMPPCFAGLEAPEPHDGEGIPASAVGTFGFNEELEICVICEHELRCMDAKEERGL